MGNHFDDKSQILDAFRQFDDLYGSFDRWYDNEGYHSQKYAVFYRMCLYPPKKIARIVAKNPQDYLSGGQYHINSEFKKYGFEVIEIKHYLNLRKIGDPVFGSIPGIKEDEVFESYAALCKSKIHSSLDGKISYSIHKGAASIVLDIDDVYRSEGDESLILENFCADLGIIERSILARNQINGLPVRVIFARELPLSEYHYAGLYRVEDHWQDPNTVTARISKYRLVKAQEFSDTAQELDDATKNHDSSAKPRRKSSIVLRIVRDTELSRRVKEFYNYRCQICGIRLEGMAGPYAEAAHIRPLGTPHDGPDALDNILCLCPNHHILFDLGGVAIQSDFTLLGEPGVLKVHRNHNINIKYLEYHRSRYFPE